MCGRAGFSFGQHICLQRSQFKPCNSIVAYQWVLCHTFVGEGAGLTSGNPALPCKGRREVSVTWCSVRQLRCLLVRKTPEQLLLQNGHLKEQPGYILILQLFSFDEVILFLSPKKKYYEGSKIKL